MPETRRLISEYFMAWEMQQPCQRRIAFAVNDLRGMGLGLMFTGVAARAS
jgi:hypothetical protein